MGGLGSGRREETYNYTVEDCRSIDINRWGQKGIIKPNHRSYGTWVWYADEDRTEQGASIGFDVNCEADYGYVRLIYTWDNQIKIDYPVRLKTTPVHFGGLRWWFICPGIRCGKKVGKLYIAPNSKDFLCRTCQNLTYTSCRSSHRFDKIYALIAADAGVTPWEVKQVFK